MPRRLKVWITLSAAIICLSLAECYADGARKSITIAILPCYDVVKNFEKFNPLIDYLKQQTRYDIGTIVPRSLAELRASLQKGSIDFVLQDPHTYVSTAVLYSKESLLVARH